MGHAEAVRELGAPAAAVWHALNDIERTPEWVVGLVGGALRQTLARLDAYPARQAG